MKTRTNLSAGYNTLEECQADALYWKSMSSAMEVFAKTGVWYGPTKPPVYPPTEPTYPTYPTYPTQPPPPSGGYVGGVWYPDYSGYCG